MRIDQNFDGQSFYDSDCYGQQKVGLWFRIVHKLLRTIEAIVNSQIEQSAKLLTATCSFTNSMIFNELYSIKSYYGVNHLF